MSDLKCSPNGRPKLGQYAQNTTSCACRQPERTTVIGRNTCDERSRITPQVDADERRRIKARELLQRFFLCAVRFAAGTMEWYNRA